MQFDLDLHLYYWLSEIRSYCDDSFVLLIDAYCLIDFQLILCYAVMIFIHFDWLT